MNDPDRPKVLLAEDEQVCSLVVKRLIEKAGYDVVLVRDGKSALRELENGDFYAVVADWMLPELDGIEVVRKVVARPGNKTKAFLTSVIDIPAAREHAAAAGAQDFLPKPLTPGVLIKALRAEAKPVALKTLEGNHPMTRAEPWHRLPLLSARPISDILGTEVTVELATAVADAPVRYTCGLVDATNGSELTVWAVARDSAAISTATAMLGEAPANVQEAAEALAEVLNVVAGVIKTEFSKAGFKFTIVLPKRVSAADLKAMEKGSFASIVTNVTLGESTFTLGFTAASASAVEMRVEDLREGFVLAEDMRNASGTLILLPACTRLTATAVQRLRESCKGRSVRVHVPLSSVA